MFTRLLGFTLHWGWLCAVLGGLVYLGLFVIVETFFPEHWAGSPSRLLGFSYVAYSRLLFIPLVLFLFGLTNVYIRLSFAIGRLGKLGFVLALSGFGLDILGNFIEFWAYGLLLVPFIGEFRTGSAGSQFGYEISGYGTIFLIIGLLLFGVACFRSNLPFRWRVLPFATGLIYATSLIFYFVELLVFHAVLFGISWILLGYYLKKDKHDDLLIPI